MPKAHLLKKPLPEEASLEQLRRRNAELVEAVAARDTFIALAAHELRNPMTPMIGQVEHLLSGIRAGKHSVQQIEPRLDRILQVMAHYVKRATILLDVSRITTGKLRLEPTACDVSEVTRRVTKTFAEAARYADTVIETDIPASLPSRRDQLAVEQIIDNLVLNAIEYGSRQPIEVRAEDRGGSVHITVRDHGPGISADDRARIFGRFERAVGRASGAAGSALACGRRDSWPRRWVTRQAEGPSSA